MPGQGDFAAIYLVSVRIIQGIGGALLMANSTAILTDAFPAKRARLRARHQRRGGDRRPVPRPGDRRPACRYRTGGWCSGSTCRSASSARSGRTSSCTIAPNRSTHTIDWLGNISFGLGLVLMLTAITDGMQPYGDQVMAWASPQVLVLFAIGFVSLIAFVVHRAARRQADARSQAVPHPAGFAYGNIANLLGASGAAGCSSC